MRTALPEVMRVQLPGGDAERFGVAPIPRPSARPTPRPNRRSPLASARPQRLPTQIASPAACPMECPCRAGGLCRHHWALDTWRSVPTTAEDTLRTQMYRQKEARRLARRELRALPLSAPQLLSKSRPPGLRTAPRAPPWTT